MNLTIRVALIPLALIAGCSSSRKHTIAERPASAVVLSDNARLSLRERAIGVMVESCGANDPRIRSNAMEAAALVPERNIDLIRRGLSDENVAVRTTALMMVGKHRMGTLLEEAKILLRDTSPYVQCSAIYACLECGEDVDRRPLAWSLLGDPSTRIRSHAAFILGELGDSSALPLLRQALRERPARASQVEVNLFQLQVAEAMIKLGDEGQLEAIRAALYPSRPEDLEATALAVQIVGEVRDKGTIDHLIYLSATRDPSGQMMPAEVRLAVASSLAKMGLPQGDFIADEFVKSTNPAIRSQVAFVYGETRTPGNLGVLEKMLSDPDGGVRIAAATAIVKIAESVAPEPDASLPRR